MEFCGFLLQKLAKSSDAEGSVPTNGVDNSGRQPTHGIDLCDVEHVPLVAVERLQNPATG